MPEPLPPGDPDLAADPELGPLLAACPDIVALRFRDGERLVTEGEESQDLYIVRRGSLVVEKALPDGTARPLAQLACHPDTPCIVGEMASFGAQQRTATVRAVGSCQALHLRPPHLDVIMAGFPGLTRVLCRQFTSRLKEANEELRDLRARFHLRAEPRHIQAGERLYSADEPAEAVFQVLLGSVRLDGPGGDLVLRGEDLPGGFLGLEPFLRGQPYGANATAVEDCLLAVIPAEYRLAFLRCHPELALALLRG